MAGNDNTSEELRQPADLTPDLTDGSEKSGLSITDIGYFQVGPDQTGKLDRLPLGSVTLNPDGSLSLSMRTATSDLIGDVVMDVKPGDPEYAKIMKQLSSLHPGETEMLYSPSATESGVGRIDEGLRNFEQLQVRESIQPGKLENFGCSPEHFGRVKDAIGTLPDNVQGFLAKHGWQFAAADNMLQAFDKLNYHPNGPPRGYPPGWGWDALDGTALSGVSPHRIIVNEWHKAPVKHANDRVDGVLRHETGHAVDQSLGNYSHSAEFNKTFRDEVSKMPPEIQKRLSYYLQPGAAGNEESFAEMFAMACGGGSAERQLDALLEQYCQKTLSLVRNKIESLH